MGVEPTLDQEFNQGRATVLKTVQNAVPAWSRLLPPVPGENEMGKSVGHGAPGHPRGLHGFAADFAARQTRPGESRWSIRCGGAETAVLT